MIRHRTFHSRGVPWIERYSTGVEYAGECGECEGHRDRGSPEMVAELKRNRCRLWPDLIGSGSVLLMVASGVFVDAMRGEGITVETGGRVRFAEPLRNGLSPEDAPPYFWIDGGKMRAASMDYEASGYVGVEKCTKYVSDVGHRQRQSKEQQLIKSIEKHLKDRHLNESL